MLLGTQMIAKGLDFPNVTLVGVVDADVGINLPDFRASERCFQLLSQVAGRAGRGPKGGECSFRRACRSHHAVRLRGEARLRGLRPRGADGARIAGVSADDSAREHRLQRHDGGDTARLAASAVGVARRAC